MKRLIVLDISPATETHCGTERGRCDKLDAGWPRCDAFPRSKEDPKLDHDALEYRRLPECIAAEQNAAQKGGSQ